MLGRNVREIFYIPYVGNVIMFKGLYKNNVHKAITFIFIYE